MSPITRIVHWNDEDNQLWRAGLLAAIRNRFHALTDAQRALLVVGLFGLASMVLALSR
ncbi:MAG: hypothetical protein ACHQ53_08655 [Polyangiales bacterium]